MQAGRSYLVYSSQPKPDEPCKVLLISCRLASQDGVRYVDVRNGFMLNPLQESAVKALTGDVRLLPGIFLSGDITKGGKV